jgi:DNA-directed RNA polymerase specialized sigma24 family protein
MAPILNEEAFLTHAVLNLSIDLHRRSPPARPFKQYDASTHLIDFRTPEQALEIEQRLSSIRELIDSRSVRVRQVFFAHRAGYSYNEIASHFKLSPISIRRHIARALSLIIGETPLK